MMESTQHAQSLFVTLTYSEDHIPAGASLQPRDLQLWLKRLRSAIAPAKVRFYAVGEYGDKTQRPHYHVALFGLPVRVPLDKHSQTCECVLCASWSMGLVHVGAITMESAAYVASYTVKKMTQVTDPRLAGRHPEFARMSLRPGIGHSAMRSFKEALIDKGTGELRLVREDVPVVARVLGRKWPIGRYLRRILRRALLGVDAPSAAARAISGLELLFEGQSYGSTKAYLEAKEKGREVRRNSAESRERIQRQKKGSGL